MVATQDLLAGGATVVAHSAKARKSGRMPRTGS